MEAEEILARVHKGEDVPDDWVVFPLLRDKILWNIIGWACGFLMGLALLILVVPIMVPYNFLQGPGLIIFSLILLGILLLATVGSAWLLISDFLRLRQAKKHVIVITDKFFVKQEGDKIECIPLHAIRHVTPRGRRPAPVSSVHSPSRVSPLGTMFGQHAVPSTDTEKALRRQRRMRVPTSLAFVDTRTETEVTVAKDMGYGDPFTIAAVLKEYMAAVQS